jgi:hypothetical protein
MAGFHHKTFTIHDDYMTPKSVWKAIEKYIPKDKVIWEAFYGDGKSGDHLLELGFKVIHESIDFFEHNLGDIVVSNPPFSQCSKVLSRLKELKKPFILIIPSSKINTSYAIDVFKDGGLQLIIPRRRIQFIKMIDGVVHNFKGQCNFDCMYYCWNMNLPKDIIFLTE